MAKVCGFVLAGGKSSRMGTDKSLLLFRGRTLLESALERVRNVAGEVVIVGRAGLAAYAPVVADIYPDCGPLGGIHAALKSSARELNIILAVDMPFVPATFLEKLVAAAGRSPALVTVPQTTDGFQPLCAVYRRDFLPVAETALKSGNYKIDRLFVPGNASVVKEEEISRWGFGPEIFANLNSPQDLEKALPIQSGAPS